jgi:predicted RecA/RadA family phage recombinase
MATNYVQPGKVLTFTAPEGGVVSGSPYQIGQLVVIALVTAAAGDQFAAAVTGVWSVTKPGSQPWSEGALVYFDAGDSTFTTVAAGNLRCGAAAEAVGSGMSATTGKVRLDGVARDNEGS